MKIVEDEDIKTLQSQKNEQIEKVTKELDEKYSLSEDEEKLLKEVISHVGKISHGGNGGLKLNFEDYKRLVKIMIMFGEELNWLNGKEQKNREVRRALMAAEKMDEYWNCIKQ